MHRWVPLGRDLGQTLNLYSYVLAYVHKTMTLCFPNISLYHVTLYAPVVCFIFGLGVLCLFLSRAFGQLFSSVVGIFLATLPGAIIRSVAGFSDRDSWCLMLGILAVTTYLASLQTQPLRQRILWTLASGFSMFLGGLSWEGFGMFLLVILVVELWRFLTSETEEGLWLFLLWTLTFVPTLYLASPAYRSGYGFATHLFAFMLVPPLVVFTLRALRHLLTTKEPLAKKLRPHSRSLALGLTLVSLTGALLYVFSQFDTFTNTTVLLNQNRLLQTVQELTDSDYQSWVSRYGSISFLGSIGLMIASMHYWKKLGPVLVFPLSLFVVTTFFSEQLNTFLGRNTSTLLFFASIILNASVFLLIAWRRNESPKNELTYIASAVWLLSWGGLTRDAARYSFFIGPAITFFTAELICLGSTALSKKLKHGRALSQRIPQYLLKSGITLAMLAALMFWTPIGGYAKRTYLAIKIRQKAFTENTHTKNAFQWMKVQLPETAVVAANWTHGSQLNVLGGVKTIIDQDHFIQHWIHLYCRYLFCGHSNEALQFLKTHEATHLMFTETNVVEGATSSSYVGSTSKLELQFEIIPLLMAAPKKKQLRFIPMKQTPFFKNIRIDLHRDAHTTIAATAKLKNDNSTVLPCVAYLNQERIHSVNQNGSEIGGIILYFDERQKFQKGYYVPSIAWDNFAIRLFLRGMSNDAFVPVYPADGDPTAEVKVWEIHYPPDIKPHPKYLATEPEK